MRSVQGHHMFQDFNSLQQRFRQLGAKTIFFKCLAENDNSKQQIYLGGSFEAIQLLPFDEVRVFPDLKIPNYKAKIKLFWIDDLHIEQATGAQLILYPQYPEVRLSGFLERCKLAPSINMQPVPARDRKNNNDHDGRILFFGIASGDRVLAYLVPKNSNISNECFAKIRSGDFYQEGIFFHVKTTQEQASSRDILMSKLIEIKEAGWQRSVKLDKNGVPQPYKAKNGGGYTLEALLGVIPNARAEPDFMGWELKAYSSDKISLFTPEPDGGLYGNDGIKAFVTRFGKESRPGTLYFTGLHRSGTRQDSTGLTLNIVGFDSAKQRIVDIKGGVSLFADNGDVAAHWSFAHLMEKWNKKHAQAAYVPYAARGEMLREYCYCSPVLLGEGTDFSLFLSAMSRGLIYFDPGTKVTIGVDGKTAVKPRSQFRLGVKNLSSLYRSFTHVDI